MHALLQVLASFVLLLFQPVAAPVGLVQPSGSSPSANPFFAKESLVELTLTLPHDCILNDRGPSPGTHSAALSYQEANGAPRSVPVLVQVRGNRRKDPAVCDFPPLLVIFPPASRTGTIFGPVEELKLTTHCLSDTYTLREYLVYKLYNVLTDFSYRVRLCRITYQDAERREKASVHYGFFLENTGALAQRNQAKAVPKQLFITMDNLDQTTAATMTIFQYMIGNTDWSVPFRHNIRLLTQNVQTPPLPVAYDFDYSGLVMAPYAVPPEQLGITSVRQRLYRGFDFPPATFAHVRDMFNARRAALYDVYLRCPYLSAEEQEFATRYLNGFYKVLNDPKDFERNIVRVGRRNQKQYTHIRGYD
ncbi:hypothetical protein ACFQT0_29405 [Hymenobacter humi]|uniref:Uncharacterized protein n=1 Tax=Hymenobacter humi TaxID=1411620 RepID=A0ABW2UBX7_9BACT